MGYGGVFGVHDPIWWAFYLSPNGDGEFLVFGNVVPGGNYPFGRCIGKGIASDICVSSYLCRAVGSPSLALYMRISTMVVMSGL